MTPSEAFVETLAANSYLQIEAPHSFFAAMPSSRRSASWPNTRRTTPKAEP